MTHRIRARRPARTSPPEVRDDSDIVAAFLEDAAHVGGGQASGVAFPRNDAEVSAQVSTATRVLVVGAQSSLTGGATPRGNVVLSTRMLTAFKSIDASAVRVGAGMPLLDLQSRLAVDHRWYPPVPTFEGAFVGGTIATNAAGAATFKYGSTRAWVRAATIVLADGSILDLERGTTVDAGGSFEIEAPGGDVTRVTIPTYRMPGVAKHSGGYYARPGMDVLDLFIGSEGTLGVVVDATLNVIPRPPGWIAVVPCRSDAQAITITAALRAASQGTWAQPSDDGIDVAGVEYVDARALRLLGADAWARAQISWPSAPAALLIVQLERGLEAFASLIQGHGVVDDVSMASREDARATARLLELREAVPLTVNQRVAAARASDPRIEKTAGDMIVPFDQLGTSLEIYRDAFYHRGLDCAIWGHFSDGNLHPNLLPRSFDEVERGRDALMEIGQRITVLGGSPLAEHGVGRSPVKQALLRQLYGERGIEQMRAVKRALDPEWKLADGVIFQRTEWTEPR